MTTDRNEPSLPSGAVQAALETALGYLVMQVRMRDGVPTPPLLDRDDFLDYVESAIGAPAARWSPEERRGLDWLCRTLRHFGAGNAE